MKQPHSLLNPPIPATPKQNYHMAWPDLSLTGLALAASQATLQYDQPIIIITANSLDAQHLVTAGRYFLNNHATEKANQDISVKQFPDWETLPYDQFSPHQDIISERLDTLAALPQMRKGIVVVPINTLMLRLAPVPYIQGHSLRFNKGDILDLQKYIENLQHCGYTRVNKVMEHGEYAVRGSIIDIYPMGLNTPYRIELFDDEIDSIREFDPDDQRSSTPVDNIACLPAHEFPLTDTAVTNFRRNWRESFAGNPMHCAIYEAISEKLPPAGIEYYIPLFFEETASFFDYCPENSWVIKCPNVGEQAEKFWHEIEHRYTQYNFDVTRPLLDADKISFTPAEIFGQAKQYPVTDIKAQSSNTLEFAIQPVPDLKIQRAAANPLQKVINYIQASNDRILICAESMGRREVIAELFREHGVALEIVDDWHAFLAGKQQLAITVAPLTDALNLAEPNISFITEPALYGEIAIPQQRGRRGKTIDPDSLIRDLTELRVGTPVVHAEHGIALYNGLQTMQIDNYSEEFLVLSFEAGDKIYVPVTNIDLISRYTGLDTDNVNLTKLGSGRWDRAKQKALEKIRDVAAELLDVYAKRESKPGFAFKKPDQQYNAFCAKFPFIETADQMSAIIAIIDDMTAPRAMDRLICGDVGFGKTEVAMRAAFLAIASKKQVAVLVPTTLLASQHYNNFQDRFADFPVNIELLSRFRTAGEQDTTIEKLASGKVDIVIGTHKLIQKGIKFKDLGLLIVDEEHRFGVRQKEHIKALRNDVDILSLTATPIPRTLNMAMSGMRDISLIATPPARRLAVKTFKGAPNRQLVREAILREIMRGGQVFYLHNEVKDIYAQAEKLRELVPEAKIDVGHGQMRERELEQVMSNFYHQRFNVLLCTTIVENGIDIPTANTMIIDRADHFGIAQLHQLRGRVGRSHHQAYCYLLVPNEKLITSDAKKRLNAFMSLEDLGAGFTLATHDLEIRGAGELLGDQQSGEMHSIGFELYMELLERAVTALKAGKQIDFDSPFEHVGDVNLQISAIIPAKYIDDIQTRLSMYKRIAHAGDKDKLDELQVELIDRFGLLPDEVKNLFRVMELKLRARELGINKIDFNKAGGVFEFSANPKIKPEILIKLIQTQASKYQLAGPEKLRVKIATGSASERIDCVAETLKTLVD